MLRVTQIIKRAGLMGDSINWSNEEALQRGTAVHQATAFDDAGDLDAASVDPRIAGYLDGWRKFRREVPIQIVAIEEHVVHPVYGYEGTLDRRFILHGKQGILDIKTGMAQRWHALQLASYAATFIGVPLTRLSVYLADDGAYKMQEYKDRHDWEVFKAALTIATWIGDKE